ncbi:MAG: polysaccharide deacetylase family protein [Lachnospiraceae bacterium]|nr:polysaccharide deacetylase family protein [Lachnospiraceae bacterium]
MWNNKMKAFTLSYDDGITQDIRFVELLNRYGLKATFNLNSGIQTKANSWVNKDGIVVRRMNMDGLKELYAGHEIAVHSLTHPDLTKFDEETVYNELARDKANLEAFFGTKITGMAYPFGTHNEQVRAVAKKVGLHYARTVHSTNHFELPADLLQLPATCHHGAENLMDLAKQFAEAKPDMPQLFYVWGHSYEFDFDQSWERIEEFFRYISGREDIFYGTNAEVLEPFYTEGALWGE